MKTTHNAHRHTGHPNHYPLLHFVLEPRTHATLVQLLFINNNMRAKGGRDRDLHPFPSTPDHRYGKATSCQRW